MLAHGSDLPLWEAGGGMVNFRANQYRGAQQFRNFHIPFPAFIYRGASVEADNSFIRKHFIKKEKYVLDLSFTLGLNVNSKDNRLRQGMDNLNPTFEVGPIFRYYLFKSANDLNYINFEVPYRAVFATNLQHLHHVGYFSVPYFNFIFRPRPSTFQWSNEFSVGAMYGSQEYHDYYYGVDPRFMTPSRRQYRPQAGYSGAQLTWVASRRIGDVLFLPFVRYDYLEGVAFKKSPLFENKSYVVFGAAVVWYFYSSNERATAPTIVK